MIFDFIRRDVSSRVVVSRRGLYSSPLRCTCNERYFTFNIMRFGVCPTPAVVTASEFRLRQKKKTRYSILLPSIKRTLFNYFYCS